MTAAAAPPVPKKYVPDEMERAILARWAKDKTFEAQVQAGRKAFEAGGHRSQDRYVFLEGPPTANGLPHPGHVLTRTLKDSVCRYQAMQGKWVPRKGGWDCHGLPVEIEVQKELGIEHVDQVVAYGLAKFNQKCRESVFRYKAEWEEMCQRVGHWLDYDDPYITMDDRYIESVWWSLKTLFDRNLLFKSYKVVPYCPQTGTSYSSHEVAQGYKDVKDTAVFVKFHVEGGAPAALDARSAGAVKAGTPMSILSWTTTPWTLPGNVALAVGAAIDYVVVRVNKASDKAHAKEGDLLVVAEALQKKSLRNESTVLAKLKGKDLVGLRYQPLFPGAVDTTRPGPNGEPKAAFQVVAADFVTTEDGTGVVHTAVMYGEDDFQLGMKEGLPAQHTVGLDGKFLPHVPGGVAGGYVKDPKVEAQILSHLKAGDLLYRDEAYEHSYPHCWRTGHPLLYYAMDSWYIRMSQLRDQLLANNDQVNWVPDTIKDGRMGDWLRNVKDWAFSRNRFWGTPLPVWTCGKCKAQTCIGSKAELKAHGIDAAELHRPYVDQPIDCPKCKAKGAAVREPYVIDVWYDSGAAQFAQWGATSFTDKALQEQWPIDFITEGLDQTRGWFYSLLASSTALGSAKQAGTTPDAKAAPSSLFQGPPYRTCLVGGLILAEDGTKMSKKLRNYVSPDQVFSSQGADATRWYLLSTTAPWQDKRFYEEAVREAFGKFFGTLWNTFLFQHQYARLDHFTPEKAVPQAQWTELDQWLLSRLNATIAEARAEADRHHLHKATRAIESFVVDDLSNWWVRRSRDRFWLDPTRAPGAHGAGVHDNRPSSKELQDKASAHSALWTALHAVCRLVAPYAPFMVEHIWPHVRRASDPASVHLAPYPTAGARNEGVEAEMAAVRAIAEAGRALRSKVNIPTRHPLGRAVLVGGPSLSRFAAILQDEINVKQLEAAADARAIKSFVAKPDRKALGKSFRQLSTQVADAIEALDGDTTHAAFAAGRPVGVSIGGQDHQLSPEHIVFEEKDRPGWATTKAGETVLALHIERNEALLAEALLREVIRRVQEVRKELDLPIDEEVDVTLSTDPGSEARLAPLLHELKADVRGRDVAFGTPKGGREWDIDGTKVVCSVRATKTVRPAAVEAA